MGNQLVPVIHQSQLNAATKRAGEHLTTFRPEEIPEQVVGSAHSFPVKTLVTGAPKLTTLLSGEPHFVPIVLPDEQTEAEDPLHVVNVIYQPKSEGYHFANLLIKAVWDDNHEETRTMVITGHARNKTTPPSNSITQFSPVVDEESELQQALDKGKQSAAKAASSDAIETTKGAAAVSASFSSLAVDFSLIADHRADGVALAKSDAQAFRAPPSDIVNWLDIAMLAVSLGTGGLGAVMGMAIEGTAKTYARKFVGKLLDGALQKGMAAALSTLKSSPSGSKDSDDRHSTQDFFEVQKDAIRDETAAIANEFIRRLESEVPNYTQDKDGVVALRTALTEGLRNFSRSAKSQQRHITALKFIDYKARAELGSVRKDMKSGEITTYLEAARSKDHEYHGPFNGLLDLWVEGDGEKLRVRRARIEGISRATAEELDHQDLLRAGIPIRIQDRFTCFTRDEAGRIRAEPTPFFSMMIEETEGAEPTDWEAQGIARGEKIVNKALSKTIAEWGIRVETNDVH